MQKRNGFTILLVVCHTLYSALAAEPWYKGGNFYQIYPRSFKDRNNDGIGDLKGIISKVSYLKEIGVDGVWLSPIYKSPMADFGYDISDFEAIQPEYGTMNDFELLVNKCKEMGIRLILDFVPNHTSDQHEWFIKSANKEPGYENLYIWHPGKIENTTGKRMPPTNWISTFRFSAWQWNEKRQEYYFHQFTKEQPDLNYREPKVMEKMSDVLRFWLAKGVSGFRVDTIPSLFEVGPDQNGDFPDEPLSGQPNCGPDDYCYLNHIYTYNQNETYDVVYEWRDVLEEYVKKNGGDAPIMMTEAYSDLEFIQRYYGNGHRNGSQVPFNFHLLLKLKADSDAYTYQQLIMDWFKNMPAGVEANWVLGNHDQKRVGSRLGESRIDLHNILVKTLPGICITYMGDELGMTDTIISWKDTVDPQACNTNETVYHANSRDAARTPFQWDNSVNAGFNDGNKTWLPVNVNYKCVNVKTETEPQPSHLNVYKRLVKLRKEHSLATASFESSTIGSEVFAYKRQSGNLKPIYVVMNVGKQWKTINLQSVFDAPAKLEVIVASIQSQYQEGEIVNANVLTIPTDVALVLN